VGITDKRIVKSLLIFIDNNERNTFDHFENRNIIKEQIEYRIRQLNIKKLPKEE